MFDGPESPVTQTFGLGMFQEPTASDMQRIEAFFADLGSPVYHEISPLAPKSMLPMLHRRGYWPFEFTTVLYLPLEGLTSVTQEVGRVQTRLAKPDESTVWVRTALEGWRDQGDIAGLLDELFQVNASKSGSLSFLAEIDGNPVATGGMFLHEGVAMMSGASTIPHARKQGAQRALFEARLRYAMERGCDVAVVGGEPGGATQRNAERMGFRVAYTRAKWRQDHIGNSAPN